MVRHSSRTLAVDHPVAVSRYEQVDAVFHPKNAGNSEYVRALLQTRRDYHALCDEFWHGTGPARPGTDSAGHAVKTAENATLRLPSGSSREEYFEVQFRGVG
jgi:hypothetical protein